MSRETPSYTPENPPTIQAQDTIAIAQQSLGSIEQATGPAGETRIVALDTGSHQVFGTPDGIPFASGNTPTTGAELNKMQELQQLATSTDFTEIKNQYQEITGPDSPIILEVDNQQAQFVYQTSTGQRLILIREGKQYQPNQEVGIQFQEDPNGVRSGQFQLQRGDVIVITHKDQVPEIPQDISQIEPQHRAAYINQQADEWDSMKPEHSTMTYTVENAPDFVEDDPNIVYFTEQEQQPVREYLKDVKPADRKLIQQTLRLSLEDPEFRILYTELLNMISRPQSITYESENPNYGRAHPLKNIHYHPLIERMTQLEQQIQQLEEQESTSPEEQHQLEAAKEDLEKINQRYDTVTGKEPKTSPALEEAIRKFDQAEADAIAEFTLAQIAENKLVIESDIDQPELPSEDEGHLYDIQKLQEAGLANLKLSELRRIVQEYNWGELANEVFRSNEMAFLYNNRFQRMLIDSLRDLPNPEPDQQTTEDSQ